MNNNRQLTALAMMDIISKQKGNKKKLVNGKKHAGHGYLLNQMDNYNKSNWILKTGFRIQKLQQHRLFLLNNL